MGANERRRAILELLCQRKQDTMKNLANEFHVSLRTICYDIDELARNYPIVTTRGKYKGGVKIADGYRLDRKYLNPEQQHLLKRLSKMHTAVASGHGCGAQRPLCGLTATPI